MADLSKFVKPLVWELFWDQSKGHREQAIAFDYIPYNVSEEGWWFPLGRLNKCGGLEAAKAAAQADYTARILSALDVEALEAAMAGPSEAYADFPEIDWTPEQQALVDRVNAEAKAMGLTVIEDVKPDNIPDMTTPGDRDYDC